MEQECTTTLADTGRIETGDHFFPVVDLDWAAEAGVEIRALCGAWLFAPLDDGPPVAAPSRPRPTDCASCVACLPRQWQLVE